VIGRKRALAIAVSLLEAGCDTEGVCLACGAEASGVEPDASGYTCEGCGEPSVSGAEEIVLMFGF
jgi:hypothetical protein